MASHCRQMVVSNPISKGNTYSRGGRTLSLALWGRAGLRGDAWGRMGWFRETALSVARAGHLLRSRPRADAEPRMSLDTPTVSTQTLPSHTPTLLLFVGAPLGLQPLHRVKTQQFEQVAGVICQSYPRHARKIFCSKEYFAEFAQHPGVITQGGIPERATLNYCNPQ